MNKEEKALEYFRNSFNCSQAVFTVYGNDYGLSEDDSLKIACAFGGGIGRQQLTCGAVTGALMAIGLKCGKGKSDDDSKKQETYRLTREFFDRFSKLNGSVNCRELLLGLDLNDEADHRRIMELGLFESHCEKYVSDAVTIVNELTAENGK
jgi:C_GCAxxG_C_C family probable redox protein